MAGQGSRNGKPAGSEKSSPEGDSQETTTCYVVGPGALMRTVVKDGKRSSEAVQPGGTLELTNEEIEKYGDAVARGGAPPKPKPASKRSAGKYRVKGPGTVLYRKRACGPGTVLTLSAEDARSLGDSIIEEA